MKSTQPAMQVATPRRKARTKGQTGMPFSLIVPGRTAVEWLESIELRTQLLLGERKGLAPDALQDAREAIRIAALARRAIAAGKVEAATWGAMQALQAAWCVELKIGARPAVIGHNVSQRKRSEGGHSKPKPAWHDECAKHARMLKREFEPHQIVAKCKKKFKMSDDAIRTMLQDKRILPRNRAR